MQSVYERLPKVAKRLVKELLLLPADNNLKTLSCYHYPQTTISSLKMTQASRVQDCSNEN